jgi:hypothetical protein
MPATLNPGSQIEIPQQIIDTIKVVNHQVEQNIEYWIDIYYVFGTVVDGEFVQYFDPVTAMGIPVQRVKLEDGNHPLRPGSSLRKCPTCGKWFQLESACDEPECEGVATVPYDGFTRAMLWGAGDPDYYEAPVCPYMVTKRAIYEFLMAEQVPDPDDWPNMRPLVDASDWE